MRATASSARSKPRTASRPASRLKRAVAQYHFGADTNLSPSNLPGPLLQCRQEEYRVNTIKEVFGGRAGLAKTYWVYGIFGALLWAVAISLVTPGSTPALIAVLAFCTYQLAVNLGVWRAASVYTGPTTWAMLAKLASALGILISVGVIAMVFVVRSGGSLEVPHRAVKPAAPAPAPSAHPAPSTPPQTQATPAPSGDAPFTGKLDSK